MLVKCSTENIGEVVKESRLSEKSEGSHAVVKYLDRDFKLGWTEGPDKKGDVCKGKRKGRPKKESLVISEFCFGVKKAVPKKVTCEEAKTVDALSDTQSRLAEVVE